MASDKAEAIHAKLEARSKRIGFLKPYTEIEDGLYVGGKAGNDGMGAGYKVTDYPKTDAILGVNEDAPSHSVGDPFYKANLWMPIFDRPPFPGLGWLCIAVDFVCDCIDAGWSIYVHCSVGLSRSFMVVTGYTMKKYGYGAEEALMKLSLKRPGVPKAAFIDGLLDYEAYLKNEATKTPSKRST